MIPVEVPINDPTYPAALRRHLNYRAPKRISAFGNFDLLKRKKIALFCSVQCPGNLILKTYDLARELREAGIPVIRGFHSPMEKECLSLLLKGKQPVVWCLAKRPNFKGFPKEYVQPIEEGRLLALSPFDARVKRPTQETASSRNEVVAALADQIFVAYAAPGSKTESFCKRVVEWKKPLLTFGGKENKSLLTVGAISSDEAGNWRRALA